MKICAPLQQNTVKTKLNGFSVVVCNYRGLILLIMITCLVGFVFKIVCKFSGNKVRLHSYIGYFIGFLALSEVYIV